MKVTGQTLLDWGFKPGKWWKEAIAAADKLARENHFGNGNWTEFDMIAEVKKFEPVPIVVTAPQNPANVPTHYNIEAFTDYEISWLDTTVLIGRQRRQRRKRGVSGRWKEDHD